MSRWFEHPCTSKLLEGDQVLNVLRFINEASQCFKKHYGDPDSKESPLEDILKMWPDKSSIKKEWLRRVLENGPMNDKIQSMQSVISEFPMYSLFYLDSLISLVNPNKKRFAIIASDILAEIFVNYLLPKIRPLININERPLSTLNDMKNKPEKAKEKTGIPSREKNLCYWYFEEQLKLRYMRFIKALEELLKNESDTTNKIKIVNLFFHLSQTKENQTQLLDILVNKLGDKNKKVVGCAFSKLADIAFKHHILMSKIVRSVRKFVFRPNLSKQAQYYAIQLLAHCQINKRHLKSEPLDPEDTEMQSTNIAVEMIQVYIGIFKCLIDTSKTKCEKLYTAIMSGLSRAIPFTKVVDMQKYTNSLFELVHSSNLGLSVRVLKLLYLIIKTKSEGESNVDNYDRYQRLVYDTVMNPAVFFNSQKVSLVDIFFRSLATDTNTTRVKAMVKRLLQLCLHHPEPGFICVCLLFLSRLTNSKHKTIFDIAQPVAATTQVKMPTITSDQASLVESEESGDEYYSDIQSDDENSDIKPDDENSDIKPDYENSDIKPGDELAEPVASAKDKQTLTTSWVHYNNQKEKIATRNAFYDPFARNPKYANADREHLVELDLLSNHYHPSVRIFVQQIRDMKRIEYKTDPSEDLSLARFLDKFAYKNPKKVDDMRKRFQASAARIKQDETRQIAVNSKQFADLNEDAVPEDQKFFHQYFNHAKKTRPVRSDDEEDIEAKFSDSDTEFDHYLHKAQKVEADLFDGDDDDVDLGDLDDDEDLDLDDDDDDDDEDLDDADDGDVHLDAFDEDMEAMYLEEGDNNVDMSVDEGNEEEDESNGDMSQDDEEEATIHSSKRRRLGAELADITTGALSLGKKFDKIKDHATGKIRRDRKIRKKSKNKFPKNNSQFNKAKPGKKNFRK